MKKIVILPFVLIASSVMASPVLADIETGLKFHEILLISIMVLMCGVLLLVTYQLYQLVQTLVQPKNQEDETYRQALESRTFWQKLASLKPLSMEKDLEMEHKFDGITELDNPTPPWFMYLFYSTIAFAVIYLVSFHVVGNGEVMTNEYAEEMTIADKAHEQYMKKFANLVNEDNVKALTDTKSLADGKIIYTQNCVACHGDKGQGGVGPNMADKYWIHGGSVKNIFHTITEGVPEKGMISWKKTLNPLQIQHVVSFLNTLQGTNPANGKAPQGDKYEGVK